jgi:hypothetical protein
VTKIGELGTTQAATSNRRTLRRNNFFAAFVAPGSFETSVLTRATRRNNPEDTILHSHRRENLKSYNNGHCLSAEYFEHGTEFHGSVNFMNSLTN